MKKLRKIMKVICVLMAFAVMLGLFTACDQHDDKVDPTSRETETQITPDFSEPNQSIASSVATTETETSSSETATPTQSGAYTYEAYGYSFAMDINIDDYIYVSEYTGNTCFNLYSLAEDLGWRPHRADGDTSYLRLNYFDYARYDFSKAMENPVTLKLWLASKRGDK